MSSAAIAEAFAIPWSAHVSIQFINYSTNINVTIAISKISVVGHVDSVLKSRVQLVSS